MQNTSVNFNGTQTLREILTRGNKNHELGTILQQEQEEQPKPSPQPIDTSSSNSLTCDGKADKSQHMENKGRECLVISCNNLAVSS